jgi:hypothetical protein
MKQKRLETSFTFAWAMISIIALPSMRSGSVIPRVMGCHVEELCKLFRLPEKRLETSFTPGVNIRTAINRLRQSCAGC